MTEQTIPDRLKDALQGVNTDQAASAERVRRALRGESAVEAERVARLGEALTGAPAAPTEAEAERLARALSGDAPHAPAQPEEPSAPAPAVEARRFDPGPHRAASEAGARSRHRAPAGSSVRLPSLKAGTP